MKELKIIVVAILFFILGSGTSVYFVSNVKANKEAYRQRIVKRQQEQKEQDERRLVLKLKEIEFDLSGLESVDDFHVSISDCQGNFWPENEIIRRVWPAYKNILTTILEGGLKQQGLRIVSDAFDENGEPIISDSLNLAICAVREEPSGTIAGSLELSLRGTFVNYETKKFVNADRWDKMQAFMVKETDAAKRLEEITRGLMDDFIKDYIKANPRKK